ncbi:Daunorubicin resistance ATP-binding protein (DrrA), partial [Lacticaseibacillus paracasei subsp. paracasei Lpp227]
MAILEAKGLTKTFGPKVAVNGINLTVDRGQFVAFLGPNGAGKSTTIGMLTGLIQPTSGTITVADHTPEQVAYRQQIGVVFQDSVLDRQLTVNENLRLRARMYQHPDTAWFDQLIKQFDLA